MSRRKLWKVVDGAYVYRPESKLKAYAYVHHAVTSRVSGARRHDRRFIRVYVDERLGCGWQMYERVDLDKLAGLEAEADS